MGRNHTEAGIDVSITNYSAGRLVVEASRDGHDWLPAGEAASDGNAALTLPEALFPAGEVYVRLRGLASAAAEGDAGPCAFTLATYAYRAALDGAPVTLRGETRFVAVTAVEPNVTVVIDSLGDAVPGGANAIRLQIDNGTGGPVSAAPSVTLTGEAGQLVLDSPEVQIPAGTSTLEIPYEVPGSGAFILEGSLGPGLTFAFRADFHVPHLFETAYGERVPGSTADVVLCARRRMEDRPDPPRAVPPGRGRRAAPRPQRDRGRPTGDFAPAAVDGIDRSRGRSDRAVRRRAARVGRGCAARALRGCRVSHR